MWWPPVLFLVRHHGSYTANVQEMDGPLGDTSRPISDECAEVLDQCPEACMAKYGHALHQVLMRAKPLTRDFLQCPLTAMRPSAIGCDGWSSKYPGGCA